MLHTNGMTLAVATIFGCKFVKYFYMSVNLQEVSILTNCKPICFSLKLWEDGLYVAN